MNLNIQFVSIENSSMFGQNREWIFERTQETYIKSQLNIAISSIKALNYFNI